MCRVNNGNAEGFVNPYIDKDLDAALDSFDNLFCRRCLVSKKYLHFILDNFLSILSNSPLCGRFLIVDYMDALRILSLL